VYTPGAVAATGTVTVFELTPPLFTTMVAVGPAVAAYVFGVAFSLDVSVVRDTWRLLVGSVVFGAVVMLSAGTLMLAISSLSRNSRLVGAMWIGLWIVSNVTADVLQQTVKRDWCPVISYTSNLARVREELLDAASARAKFVALWEAGRATGREAARSVLPFNRGRRRGRPDRPSRPSEPPPPLQTPDNVKQPWPWSAGVLGSLFVLSTYVLSTRVKSMDRLR